VGVEVRIVLTDEHEDDEGRWTDREYESLARFGLGDLNVDQTELLTWWIDVTMNDLRATLPKMAEYGGVDGQEGSADLIVMGDAQAELMGHHDMPSAWKQALACWFYLLGKVARMVSNFKRRDWPKQDTVHDARVYLMMIERLAAKGRWP
jgi:hypothetical protein